MKRPLGDGADVGEIGTVSPLAPKPVPQLDGAGIKQSELRENPAVTATGP